MHKSLPQCSLPQERAWIGLVSPIRSPSDCDTTTFIDTVGKIYIQLTLKINSLHFSQRRVPFSNGVTNCKMQTHLKSFDCWSILQKLVRVWQNAVLLSSVESWARTGSSLSSEAWAQKLGSHKIEHFAQQPGPEYNKIPKEFLQAWLGLTRYILVGL